jgi:hypothetical protein
MVTEPLLSPGNPVALWHIRGLEQPALRWGDTPARGRRHNGPALSRAVPHPNVLGGQPQHGRERQPPLGAVPHQRL